jgi:2-dehydropantoate 2-reductase
MFVLWVCQKLATNYSVPPSNIEFSSSPISAAHSDLVLLTAKSAATAAAAADLAGTLKSDAIIISFQNSLENAAMVRAAAPKVVVLDGMVPFNVVSRGPGRFHQSSQGYPL